MDPAQWPLSGEVHGGSSLFRSMTDQFLRHRRSKLLDGEQMSSLVLLVRAATYLSWADVVRARAQAEADEFIKLASTLHCYTQVLEIDDTVCLNETEPEKELLARIFSYFTLIALGLRRH